MLEWHEVSSRRSPPEGTGGHPKANVAAIRSQQTSDDRLQRISGWCYAPGNERSHALQSDVPGRRTGHGPNLGRSSMKELIKQFLDDGLSRRQLMTGLSALGLSSVAAKSMAQSLA